MSGTRSRFRGTIIGVLALVIALVVVRVVDERWAEAPPPVSDEQDAIYHFEKEDLTDILIVRPDLTIEMHKVEGEWQIEGQPWRPSRSMTRRVAHQLHDLTARAEVVNEPDDFSLYGLGEGSIRVTLTMKDGSSVSFEAGDPNPTSVSYYIRRIPGDVVYVVKKSALDYYRLDLDQFREHKFATFDANAADFLNAVVDGRRIEVKRTGEYTWHMTQPVDQKASREQVRMMLGRISALKSLDFVEDDPVDPARYGIDPPQHEVQVGLSSGETITMLIGHEIEGSSPAQRYAMRVEDNAVYAIKDGLLESYQKTAEEYRNRILLGKHEWDVTAMRVVLGAQEVAVERSSDDWRWPDGSAIPGSTPKRVAGRAADIRARGFHDDPPPDTGLDEPFAVVHLTFDDETQRSVTLGRSWEIEVEEGERPERRQFAEIDGDDVVYEVDDQLADVIEDLHREYGRKVKRDGERRIEFDVEDMDATD